MDDYGWTYGEQQAVDEWFREQEAINDQENEEYFLSTPSEAATLKRYLTTAWSAHYAAVALIAVKDTRPLCEIYGEPNSYGRDGILVWMLNGCIQNLPQTHGRISELVEAIKALKDDELGLTGPQMQDLAVWGDKIRLEQFWTIVCDCSRGQSPHHAAFEACDAARRGSGDRLWRICYYIYKALKDPDAKTRPDGLSNSPEVQILSATYCLIRAGHLVYKSLDTDAKKMHKNIYPGLEARQNMHMGYESPLWHHVGLSKPRWNFWKERLRNPTWQPAPEPKTLELIQIALAKMEQVEKNAA